VSTKRPDVFDDIVDLVDWLWHSDYCVLTHNDDLQADRDNSLVSFYFSDKKMARMFRLVHGCGC
jgi:hypothetical protein